MQKKLGLSQAELAERLEVQQPGVSKLERRQNLELNTLRSVVNALGSTIATLSWRIEIIVTYSVNLTVTDKDGGITQQSTQIAVDNIAPTATITTPNTTSSKDRPSSSA